MIDAEALLKTIEDLARPNQMYPPIARLVLLVLIYNQSQQQIADSLRENGHTTAADIVEKWTAEEWAAAVALLRKESQGE